MRASRQLQHVGRVEAPPEIAERLALPAGEPVGLRRQLFFIDDEPMQTVSAHYPVSLAAGTPIERNAPTKGSSLSIIENGHGAGRPVTQFIEDLDIRMPTPGESDTLSIPPGVRVARVLRTALDASGAALEVLDSLLPADRYLFRYVIDVPPPGSVSAQTSTRTSPIERQQAG